MFNISTSKILCTVVLLLLIFFGYLFLLAYRGEPIHDFNIWLLEMSFYSNRSIKHPDNSVLLEKKKYLGGMSQHGDPWCVYAVGEARSTHLSKQEIKDAYQGITVGHWSDRLHVSVLFADEYGGPYVLPYTDWQGELVNAPSSAGDTKYVVYVGTKWPIFLLDIRCDD